MSRATIYGLRATGRTVALATMLLVNACSPSGSAPEPTSSSTAAAPPTSITRQETPSSPSSTTTAPASEWEQLQSMGVARSETQAVEIGGIIYFPGGLSRGLNPLPAHETFEAFDPEANTWRVLADMPDKRHHVLVAAHDEFIYVFGGLDERLWLPQDNVWRYSIAEDSWEELPPLPTDLASGAAVAVGDSIFVIAGVGAARQVLEFDPVALTWTDRAPLLEPREHIAAAVLDGQIYVSGGRWSDRELSTVERYDPTLDQWHPVASLAEARAGHAMVANAGHLVAFGGEILGTRSALDSVELYDPELDQWSSGPPLPTTTHGVGAVAWRGSVYMIGGAPNAAQANATGNVYRWDP